MRERFVVIMVSFGALVMLVDAFLFLLLWGFRAEHWLWLVWLIAPIASANLIKRSGASVALAQSSPML
jgi:hypothetical protein